MPNKNLGFSSIFPVPSFLEIGKLGRWQPANKTVEKTPVSRHGGRSLGSTWIMQAFTVMKLDFRIGNEKKLVGAVYFGWHSFFLGGVLGGRVFSGVCQLGSCGLYLKS